MLTKDDDGFNNIWLTRAAEYFDQEMIKPSFYIEEAFGRSREEVQEFFRANIEDIFATVPVRPNCAKVLQRLWDSGYNIHLITARDEQHQQVTKDWLQRNGLPYHSLTMSPHQESYCKGDRCAELEIAFFVDDNLENAHEVAKRGIYTLLYEASHNRECQTTLTRVRNWLEISHHIDILLQDGLPVAP